MQSANRASHQTSDEPSLVALLDRIRARLDELVTEPLTDEQLTHLAAIDEWLEALTEGGEGA